ncbi:MAG: DNA replication checkpoint protein Drc1 [Marteilia pararefringens]
MQFQSREIESTACRTENGVNELLRSKKAEWIKAIVDCGDLIRELERNSAIAHLRLGKEDEEKLESYNRMIISEIENSRKLSKELENIFEFLPENKLKIADKLNGKKKISEELSCRVKSINESLNSYDDIIISLAKECDELEARSEMILKRNISEMCVMHERVERNVEQLNLALKYDLQAMKKHFDEKLEERMLERQERWKVGHDQLLYNQTQHSRNMVRIETEGGRDIGQTWQDKDNEFHDQKFRLIRNVHQIEKDLQRLKNDCFFNREKVEYDFEVLKKREEENAKIISSQKRKLNKLQDLAISLREKLRIAEKQQKVEATNNESAIHQIIEQIKMQTKKSEILIENDLKEHENVKRMYVKECGILVNNMNEAIETINEEANLKQDENQFKKLNVKLSQNDFGMATLGFADSSDLETEITEESAECVSESDSLESVNMQLRHEIDLSILRICDFLLQKDAKDLLRITAKNDNHFRELKLESIRKLLGLSDSKSFKKFVCVVCRQSRYEKSLDDCVMSSLLDRQNQSRSITNSETTMRLSSVKYEEKSKNNIEMEQIFAFTRKIDELFSQDNYRSQIVSITDDLSQKEEMIKECFELDRECGKLEESNRQLEELLMNYNQSLINKK